MTLAELEEIKKNYKVIEIAVDFINPSYNISRAKRLDNARYIVCTLTENGVPRTVKSSEVARIRLQKPDKQPVYNDCDILEDGRVFITLTEQILAVEGNALCDIQVTDEETGIIYSTKNFIINIDKIAIDNSAIESSYEFDALNNLIATHKKINDKLNENEEIRKANENKRIENENLRTSNENIRKNNETDRQNAESIRVANENQRISNENIRKANEIVRQNQETDRQTNTATAIKNAETATKKANDAANDLQTKLDTHYFVLTEDKGVAGGVAGLDENGKVHISQLPSYVDDVLEYSSKDSFPTIGENSKIYVDTTTNLTYRWTGTTYVEISPSLALGETSSTAYAGDKGKANAESISTLQKEIKEKIEFDSEDISTITTDPYLTQSQVVDNLTSTSTIFPLSANQGRLLSEAIKENSILLPSYYDTYMENKITEIRSIESECGIDTDSFVFITDYHMDYSDRKSNSPMLIKKILKETATRFVVSCGDTITISDSNSAHKQKIRNFVNEWDESVLRKFYPINGNHEFYASTENDLNDGEVYNTLQKQFVEYNNNSISSGLNYYFDNTNRKIRYMMVSCTRNALCTSDTLTWVKNTIETTPIGWHILICTHRGIMDGVKTSNASGIYRHGTYSNGTSVYTDLCNVIDAANSNSQATVIGILSGHQHADIMLKTSGGLNVVATNCDPAEGDCQEGRNRVIGTTSEQCFDVVNIDLTNRKVYLTRIGAYSNRSFTF